MRDRWSSSREKQCQNVSGRASGRLKRALPHKNEFYLRHLDNNGNIPLGEENAKVFQPRKIESRLDLNGMLRKKTKK